MADFQEGLGNFGWFLGCLALNRPLSVCFLGFFPSTPRLCGAKLVQTCWAFPVWCMGKLGESMEGYETVDSSAVFREKWETTGWPSAGLIPLFCFCVVYFSFAGEGFVLEKKDGCSRRFVFCLYIYIYYIQYTDKVPPLFFSYCSFCSFTWRPEELAALFPTCLRLHRIWSRDGSEEDGSLLARQGPQCRLANFLTKFITKAEIVQLKFVSCFHGPFSEGFRSLFALGENPEGWAQTIAVAKICGTTSWCLIYWNMVLRSKTGIQTSWKCFFSPLWAFIMCKIKNNTRMYLLS